MGQTLDISGSQINGARDYQEDAFLITNLGDSGDTQNAASLIIVADGMGGHAAGNVASNMAVQTFNKFVTTHYPTHAIPAMLQEAVRAANSSINETVRETPALRGMGCTLVTALATGNKLYWVSVGDSHLYLLRNRELTKKNTCHSYGGFLDRMAAAGRPIEPEAGFSRNMLMSALSGDEIAEIDCPEEALEMLPGDRIIISSDGLDSLNVAKIMSFSESTKTAKEFVGAMLKGVEDAAIPRQDNTTVVVIDMPGRTDRPAKAAAPVLRNVVAEASANTSGLSMEAAPPAAAASSGPASVFDKPKPGKQAAKRDPRDAYVRPSILPKLLLLVLLGGGAAAAYVYRDQWIDHPAIASLLAMFVPAETPAPVVEPVEPVTSTDGAEEPDTTETPDATIQTPVETTPIVTPPPVVEEFRDPSGPQMVWVQAGSFEMGSSSTWPDLTERPRHRVTLKKFGIGRHEVTIAEYSRFREAPNPFGLDPETHPVTAISWNDAVAYTSWLSGQTGKTYRLPTEAEWEFAAAADSDPQYWPWGRTEKDGQAHCFGCAPDLKPLKPTRVGSFSANAFGLFDTAGNVAEWVQDCYVNTHDGAPADGSAREVDNCEEQVVRGGSYQSPPKSIRSARRDQWPPGRPYESIGFRVVREE